MRKINNEIQVVRAGVYLLLVLLALGSCREKYNAPVHVPATGYLVVEGFIDVGGDSTKFSLSRATGLDSPYVIPENGAVVAVQAANGSSYPLTELGGGKYGMGQWSVDMSQQYRIDIKTVDGKGYQSDLSSPKLTPPIDSVSWRPSDDGTGIYIYVTTHDPTGNSRYYQWEYEEAWEYATPYLSSLIYLGNGTFAGRPDSMRYHICYLNDISTDIHIGSTAKLDADLMFEFPLELVPYGATNKLSRAYSILVRQNVLTKEWYEWEEKVKKNTEQLGSIFDAQPSDITGNIHSVSDPSEPVIGFTACSSETKQRIFIFRSQLPQTVVYTGYEDCVVDTVTFDPPGSIDRAFGSGYEIPLMPIRDGPAIVGYTGATDYCVDCRLYGGVLTKPDFWQ